MNERRLNLSLTQFLWRQFLDYWPFYLFATACLYLTHFLQSYLPFWAKELGELIGSKEQLEISKFFYLALGILIFRTSSRLLFFYPARKLEKQVKIELLQRSLSAHPKRYTNYPEGQIFQVIHNDVGQIRALIGFAFLQVGNVVLAMVVLVPKIISFNSVLLWAFLPMFLGMIFFSFLMMKYWSLFKQAQDQQGDVQNFLIESYNGKPTIKNYQAEPSFSEKFNFLSLKELDIFYRAVKGSAIGVPLIPLSVGISFLLGSYIIYQQQLGASTIILLSGFIYLFLEPLLFVSWIGVVFSRSYSSWIRIIDYVKAMDQESDYEKNLMSLNSGLGVLKFKFWQNTIELDLKKQSWNILVGPTGVGKSTLLQQVADVLLARNISLCLVSQEPYLYNDTLGNNILLGREVSESEKEYLIDLIKLFELDHLSQDQTQLLDLELGENGKRVSGGQAKRICLIRSLFTDAEYILWDDPFSSVDVILEKAIIDRLKGSPLSKDKTFIFTGHRLSTARHCHKVIYLGKEEGICEQGQTLDLIRDKKSLLYEYFKDQIVETTF